MTSNIGHINHGTVVRETPGTKGRMIGNHTLRLKERPGGFPPGLSVPAMAHSSAAHFASAIPPHLILLQSKSTCTPRPMVTGTFGCLAMSWPLSCSVTV